MKALCSPAIAVAVVAAAAIAWTPDARAEDGAVIVRGGASPPERAVIARAVEGVVREAAWSLGEPLAEQDVGAIASCLAADRPWRCIAPIAGARGLQRLVVVHAEPERAEGGELLVLTGQLAVAGGGVPAIDRRYCARCSDAELAAAAAELTRRLLEASASRTTATLLYVRTWPPGAVVTVDGRMVGESNRLFATQPGAHELLIQRTGYRPAARTVTVQEGGTGIVSVVLERESGGKGDGEARRSVQWILVGSGGIAVVGGTYASFTATSKPVGPQERYNYSPVGIGVAIVGTAAIGTGVYLWWRSSSLRSSKARSAPMISAWPGGCVAGWTTRL